MTEKLAVGITHEGCQCDEVLNPFVHHLELEGTCEKVKTALLTIILLPIRVAIICFFLIAGWMLACIGMYGLSDQDLQTKPITGWRSFLRFLTSYFIMGIFYAGGFRLKVKGKRASRSEASIVALAPHSSFVDSIAMVYMAGPSIVAKGETALIPFFGKRSLNEYLEEAADSGLKNLQLTDLLCWFGQMTYRAGGMHFVVKGQQASRQEAPIMVIAPHSTFLDGGIVYFTGFPSLIVRKESSTNPYIGKLINFTQPVYVWRDDPNSRQNTIKEIITRAKSDLDWPQILIFPEGTCTNRSCLITFKPGAFYPGVPVQPVCIRYPNKLDTVTWTWEGPSALTLLWLTLTQVYSSCEIEFLPVYYPNENERKDPKLFANNVRAVMAKALGVPVSDYTYDDCKLITRAKELNLPNANALLEVQKMRHKLRLVNNATEEKLVNDKFHWRDCLKITLNEFAQYLDVSASDPYVLQLFKIYDKKSSGVIDFREYLLGVLALSTYRSTIDTINIAFKIYDRTGKGELQMEDFTKILSHTLAMNCCEAVEIFHQIDSRGLGFVNFENFITYMAHRPEYASVFAARKQDRAKPRNGEICPSDYKKYN